MKHHTITIAVVVVAAAGLAGCATAPIDSGFGDVQRIAAERTGAIVQWDRHTADDRAVAACVHALLAKELTAGQAVQIALLNNHNLQATFEDLGIAQADLVQAGLLKNPIFDLGVRVPTRPPSNTYVDINVTEDFINVFFLPARRRLAHAQLEQVKSRVTSEVLTLATDTKAAFYAYQAAEQLVELRRSIADATAASLNAAKRLHDAGNNMDLDFINSKAQDARAKVDLADSQADAADARERLNDLMGLWGDDTAWTTAHRLPDLPAREVQRQGLETLAIRQRTDLGAARQDIAVHAQALGLTEQTRFLAETNIGAEGERETDGQWRIGPSFSLPIPLFDQGQAAIPRAQAVLIQSQQRYLALAVDVRSQVRAAAIRMFSARAKAQLYHDQVLPLQEQVVAQTQLQYNGMLVGVFQLLQVRRDQIDVARQYIESLRDYWTARAALERAIGGRLPDAATTEPSTMPCGMSLEELSKFGGLP
jgi:cobalt-zinc-cadmium efflux system outer membrane protein